MSLPDDPHAPWPPEELRDVLSELERQAAWYSGSPTELAKIYGLPQPEQGSVRWSWFWGRRTSETAKAERKIHVALPQDLAAFSSDLLFSEWPDFEIEEAREESESQSESEDALDQYNELVSDLNLKNAFIEASEICSALGGVYLRPSWNEDVSDRALLTSIHPDRAIPVFRYGVLMSVIFWRELEIDGQNVWRHFEEHEVLNGQTVISHRLYRGSKDTIGKPEDLSKHPDTEELEDTIETGVPYLDIQYVPNLRPNRRFRELDWGRSDFQGREYLFDALDEAYTSWLKDIRLGQARLVVPREFTESRGRGAGREFDLDREIFLPIEADPVKTEKLGIVPFTPDIRWEAHEKTVLNLIERIVSGNYSPQSFGLHIEGRAESGTALRIRERKTFITQERKRGYWEAPTERILQTLMLIEQTIFGRDVNPLRPRIVWPEFAGESEIELAQTLEALRRVQVISVEEAVRRQHPDWAEDDVAEEVERIRAETAVPEPTGFPA
jgi:hypothetical protein